MSTVPNNRLRASNLGRGGTTVERRRDVRRAGPGQPRASREGRATIRGAPVVSCLARTRFGRCEAR